MLPRRTKRLQNQHLSPLLSRSRTNPASRALLVAIRSRAPPRAVPATGTTAVSVAHPLLPWCAFKPLLQFPFAPLSPPHLAPRRRLLFRLPQSALSPSLALPKVHQSTRVCRHLSAFLMHPSPTLRPFNNHILHPAKRRLHPIIIRSLQCTTVNRTTSAAGHCLYSSVMLSLLRHPCRHCPLRPCRLSRQRLPFKRLHSLMLRLSYSPLHPL